MDELTEIVDGPEVIEGSGEANRWQKYGKDRIYLNDTDLANTTNPYIDLQETEFVLGWNDTYGDAPDVRMEVEDGLATITKHWSRQGEDYSKTVVLVRLFGGGDEDDRPADAGERVEGRDLIELSPEDAGEDYEWLYEGRRFANYRIDRDHYDGEDVYAVHQSTGPGILWHGTKVERVGDGEYRAACSCPANAENGECSHVHAVIAKTEHRISEIEA